MSKLSKIIVTALVIIVYLIIFTAIIATRSSAGQKGPGILGLLLFAGVVGAIKAIWKKDKDHNDHDKEGTGTSILQE